MIRGKNNSYEEDLLMAFYKRSVFGLRTVGAALACVMLLGLTAGCTSPASTNAPPTAAPTAAATTQAAATPAASVPEVPAEDEFNPADAYVMPLVKEPLTLKYMTSELSAEYKSKTSKLPITAEIERITGVILDIEAINADDYRTVFTTRMAAGSDLPDICDISGGTALAYEFGVNGFLVNMKPYVEKYDTFLEAMMISEPDIIPSFSYPDGGYYVYQSIQSGTDISDPYGWMIRRDWLEALDLGVPLNIEDWENVFYAFRNGDPNGNGEKDEIPWCPRQGLMNVLVWGSMWGLPYRSDGWRASNGKVEYGWISEDAREMFAWLVKCYDSEYLDPEFLALDHNSKVARNIAGAFVRFANNLPAFNKRAQDGGAPDAYYMGIPAPKGPDGRGGMDAYGPSNFDEAIGITKACKDPDVAFRLIDWIWGSEEANKLMWFGVEGVHWNASDSVRNAPNYLSEFFTNNPDGFNSHETALASIGGHAFFPTVRGLNGYWAYYTDAKFEAADEQLAEGITNMSPSIIPQFPILIATAEETDSVKAIEADITTYFNEQAAAFITGTRPIGDWDAFVREIESMNIAKWTEVRQQQYDRAMK